VLVRVVDRVEEIVEQRPQRTVAEAEVELVVVGLRQLDGRVRDPIPYHDARRLGFAFGDVAAPPEPESPARLHRRVHAEHQAARGR
jgi:hypothetical protein